jgi:SpoU rRNA methylase family enzyme
MQDLDDPEQREIEFVKVLNDFDASRLAIDTVLTRTAKEGVEKVLRAHRKITVGEE